MASPASVFLYIFDRHVLSALFDDEIANAHSLARQNAENITAAISRVLRCVAPFVQQLPGVMISNNGMCDSAEALLWLKEL